MASVAFLICLEDNQTRQQALLLSESIREFGGSLSDSAIYTFSPRRGLAPDAKTRSLLKDIHVEHVDDVLNEELHSLPQVNKVFITEWAERNLGEDVLVFADSDSIFLNEPFKITKLERGAAVCCAWAPGIASLGPSDPADRLWQEAAIVCDMELGEPSVTSLITHELMRPYFNTGLIATRRSARVFSIWRDTYERLKRSPRVMNILKPNRDISSQYFRPDFFIDQLAFAIAISKSGVDVEILDGHYNCPLHYRSKLDADMTGVDLSELVHVHYLSYLNWPPFLSSFNPPLDPYSRQFRFLARQTPLLPNQTVEWPPTFIDTFSFEMNQWRESLKRNPEAT